jgi:PAT family acetyl-CoA transporter-like MFS transporter 1
MRHARSSVETPQTSESENASGSPMLSDEDIADERTRLTASTTAAASPARRSSPRLREKELHFHAHHAGTPAHATSASHWAASPSRATSAILHPPMGDAIELTHPYQERTTGEELPSVDEAESGPTLKDEMPHMLLLVVLYMLQGVPLGLCLGSVPFLLQQSVSYTALGLFSLCAWPYSLKLLWSPVVDALYLDQVGRRKSWIVPIQAIIGLMLIGYSYYIQEWISSGAVVSLTAAFFSLVAFVATQDIAVDGWAISLLSKKNVAYASTCQSVGQNIGFFASYTVFLALQQPGFCNRFRSTPLDVGFLDISGYMFFWGWAFLICTAYLFVAKHEPPYVPEEGEDMRVGSLYLRMWRILQLSPVRRLALILLTCRLAFTAADSITVLKLLEKGFPKENMAMMAVVQFPFDLLLPVWIGRWSNRGNALAPFVAGYPFRLFATLLGLALVYTCPAAGVDGEGFTWWFYVRVLVVQLIYSLASNVLFVSQCSFFAQVCDSSIGGSYMTLLNTISNLGSSWPKFLIFAAVDHFTCKEKEGCSFLSADTDGYYIVSAICFCIGMVWYSYFRKRMLQLGTIEKKHWSCD